MAQGMSRHSHHLHRLPKQCDPLTASQRVGTACDRLDFGRKDLRCVACDQFGDTALMIGMMVRDQDRFQDKLLGLEACQDGMCIAGIDNHGPLP